MASATTDRRQGLTGDKGFKAPVQAATTANIVLSGEQTIDGVAVKAIGINGYPDRVLVWNQSNPIDNGVWDVSTASWTRSQDSNGTQDLVTGTMGLVTGGTLYANQQWILTTTGIISPGSTSLVFKVGIPSLPILAAASGSSLVGFSHAQSYPAGTIGAKEKQTVSVTDAPYSAVGDGTTAIPAIQAAIAAGVGRIVFPPGSYSIPANLDCGTIVLQFLPGALLTVTAGFALTVRSQIEAGNYKIFATSGTIISSGERNPCWWGAITSSTSPGATVAAANTLAFRKAAMSFYSEYVLNAGTVAAPAVGLSFSVKIPAGLFDLSNGFAAPVGAKVFGASGSGTCLRRLTANQDTDTQISLLTVGQSLAAAPGLAYQNDPGTGQSSGPFTAANLAQTAAIANDLYFVDQHPTVGAFNPKYPGCMFRDLFFTSCGIGLVISGTADMTGVNIIIDMGLTGVTINNCQNIRLENLICYYQVASSITVGANVFDSSISAHIEYPQGVGVTVTGGVQRNVKFPNFTLTQNGSTGTNVINISGNDVDLHFHHGAIRNLGGCNALVTSATSANIRFSDFVFDGNRTNPAYNQNSNMQPFTISSGNVVFENVIFRNMGIRGFISGTATAVFRDIQWSGLTGSGLMDLTGLTAGGDVQVFNAKGDASTPLLYTGSSGTGAFRAKGCSDWLGAPFNDGGTYYAWNVPMPAFGQIQTIVSAQPDGTANVRKSASYIMEKSVEALPALTDTLTQAKLWASPVANGHPELTPTIVFNSTGTTADTVNPGTPKLAKLRVPIAYASVVANVEYLA